MLLGPRTLVIRLSMSCGRLGVVIGRSGFIVAWPVSLAGGFGLPRSIGSRLISSSVRYMLLLPPFSFGFPVIVSSTSLLRRSFSLWTEPCSIGLEEEDSLFSAGFGGSSLLDWTWSSFIDLGVSSLLDSRGSSVLDPIGFMTRDTLFLEFLDFTMRLCPLLGTFSDRGEASSFSASTSAGSLWSGPGP